MNYAFIVQSLSSSSCTQMKLLGYKFKENTILHFTPVLISVLHFHREGNVFYPLR